jgi:hypothetical protein
LRTPTGAEATEAEYDQYGRARFSGSCTHALHSAWQATSAATGTGSHEVTTAALDAMMRLRFMPQTETEMRGMGSPLEPFVARAARQHEK